MGSGRTIVGGRRGIGPPISLPLKPGPRAVIKIAKLQFLLLLYPVGVAVILGILETVIRRGGGRHSEIVPNAHGFAAGAYLAFNAGLIDVDLAAMQAGELLPEKRGDGYFIAPCHHLASGCHLPHSWHLYAAKDLPLSLCVPVTHSRALLPQPIQVPVLADGGGNFGAPEGAAGPAPETLAPTAGTGLDSGGTAPVT